MFQAIHLNVRFDQQSLDFHEDSSNTKLIVLDIQKYQYYKFFIQLQLRKEFVSQQLSFDQVLQIYDEDLIQIV